MRTRAVLLFLVALGVVLVGPACGSDKDEDASSTSISPGTTAEVSTSLPGTSSSSTSSTDTSTPTSESIPPVTPPPGQPSACDLLSESALAAAGVPAGASGLSGTDPEGPPAPSNSCRWESEAGVGVALYYGRDPLEILALVRQEFAGGADVAGLGADAFYVSAEVSPEPESGVSVMFVDTGSQAFAVGGALTRDQIVALAQNVLTNL